MINVFVTERSPHSLKYYVQAFEVEPDSVQVLRAALLAACAAGPLLQALTYPERLTAMLPGVPGVLDSRWEAIPFTREVSLYVTQRGEVSGGPLAARFNDADAGPVFQVDCQSNCTGLIEIRYNHSIDR